MKIRAPISAQNRGSVLVVTIVISAVLAVTLASYLTLVSFQSRSVARSQHWNQALVIAEAGVEDALQMINKYVGTDMLTNWVNTHAADSWSLNGNVYSMTRFLDATKNSYYTVYVTNLNTKNTETVINSTGYILLPSGIASSTTLDRTVVVRARIDTLFNVAMAALGAIDLKGNGIATDSYDSGDPNYSTNGMYSKLKRKAGGDVATNNTITNSVLSVGNANVAGHIITGPYGSIDIGPNGSVGSIPWVDANTKGIETGYRRNDMNVIFDDVILPSTSWLPTGEAGSAAGGSGTAPDGNTYDHVFLLDGDYTVTDNGTIYVGTNKNVRIKATVGTFKPTKIYVAGTDNNSGKLTAYLTGTKAVLDTNHKTQSGKPKNMVIYGLPSLTDLTYNGNGDFTGVIYAPQASFALNGGGSSTWDFIGASVTKVVQMNGHYHFHYDEDLKKNGPNNGYVATKWEEL
ncbi:MAG: hypothetical protein QM813_04505 [Verrucomicrobiota bacterium]